MQFSRYILTEDLSVMENPESLRNQPSLIKLLFFGESGSHLLSHAVTSIVPSAAWVLTIVFGMGTGVTPRRIATGCPLYSGRPEHSTACKTLTSSSLERR